MVKVRIYDKQKYTDYPMQRLHTPHGNLSDSLAKDSWEYIHPKNLSGSTYHYIIHDKNHIKYKLNDPNTVEVERSQVDIFLFNKTKGYLVDTSAKGYISSVIDGQELDSSSKFVSKIKEDDRTIFKLEAGKQFSDYYVQVSKEGIFPHRIENYPTADPYCLDLLENNSCVIRSKPNRKVKRIGFRKGHTIHEVHLKDLTYLLEGVPKEIRGTYKAIGHPETLKVLQDMQVSTLEFLPLHSFDPTAAPPGHINYWGYMTRGFFALHRDYAVDSEQSIEEFQFAVEALHSVGISVVMDVVYNHTSEGDHRGPTVSFENLSRDQYFRMWNTEKGYYLNSTGVGNTCKSESPVMRQLIIDSLSYFSEYFGIDGYRFDLEQLLIKKRFEILGLNCPKTLYLPPNLGLQRMELNGDEQT